MKRYDEPRNPGTRKTLLKVVINNVHEKIKENLMDVEELMKYET